jgi:hypothetical protein
LDVAVAGATVVEVPVRLLRVGLEPPSFGGWRFFFVVGFFFVVVVVFFFVIFVVVVFVVFAEEAKVVYR